MRGLSIFALAVVAASQAQALTWTFAKFTDESLLLEGTLGAGMTVAGSFDYDSSLAGNAAVTDLNVSVFGAPSGNYGPADPWTANVDTTNGVSVVTFTTFPRFSEVFVSFVVDQTLPENSLGDANTTDEVLIGAPNPTGQLVVQERDFTAAFENRDFSIPPVRTFDIFDDVKLVNLDGGFEPEPPAPLLPDSVNEDGGFEFIIDPETIEPGEIFQIDPEIATGYDYVVEGSTFDAVMAPTQGQVPDGDGLYELMFGATSLPLASGELYEFDDPVSAFSITGIDPALMLDPDDPLAFVTGVALTTVGPDIVITQTPITTDVPDAAQVPLPAAGAGLLLGLAGLAGLRMRRRA